MKPNPILLASVSLAFLASCGGPAGVLVRDVESVSRSSEVAEGQLRFEMSVKEPLRVAVRYAAEDFVAGNRIRSGADREFIYPSSYAVPKVENGVVTPATPKELKNLKTGIVADLSTRRVSGAVLMEGTVTITEFQGFTRMAGAFGRPVLDSKERVISENRIEMPKFAIYTTPVCVAVRPGESTTFEVSAKRKTMVTLAIH
jgi:hypothetical protein